MNKEMKAAILIHNMAGLVSGIKIAMKLDSDFYTDGEVIDIIQDLLDKYEAE